MKNTDFSASVQKEAILRNANKHFVCSDRRVDPAKDLVTSERAASDANTLRLRAPRLARDELGKTA
jgi:hypothetical protein